jgi:uncharacterized protein YgiM (DUF1202 family)
MFGVPFTSSTKDVIPVATAPKRNYRGVVNAKSGLKVRSTMDTKDSSNVLAVLNFGQEVRIDIKYGDWYSLYYGNHGGYVSAQYVTLI